MKIQMSFEQWLEMRNLIDNQVNMASKKLNDYDHLKLENGLIPDHVRVTLPYQNAKKVYALAFTRLRNFNQQSPKAYLSKASKLRRNGG